MKFLEGNTTFDFMGKRYIALAFSLGAKTTVENLLAAQAIGRTYHEGDRIRIGDIEGRILRITRTGLIVETESGQTLIPARRFHEDISIQLSQGGPV